MRWHWPSSPRQTLACAQRLLGLQGFIDPQGLLKRILSGDFSLFLSFYGRKRKEILYSFH